MRSTRRSVALCTMKSVTASNLGMEVGEGGPASRRAMEGVVGGRGVCVECVYYFTIIFFLLTHMRVPTARNTCMHSCTSIPTSESPVVLSVVRGPTLSIDGKMVTNVKTLFKDEKVAK